MNLLIKNAHVVAPSHSLDGQKVDILIQKGLIQEIGKSLAYSNARQIEYPNLHISLGWFDSSVCFGEPGFEERESLSNGLQVAAKSGFTDILLNPNTSPVPDTGAHIQALRKLANANNIRLWPLGSLSSKSEGKQLAEIFDMHKAGAVGFGDFKIPIADTRLLKIALLYAQNFKGLILSFPQEKGLSEGGMAHESTSAMEVGLKGIPDLAEELQISRDLSLLEYYGGKLHIPTLSAKGSIKLIEKAKKKGLDVTCSVSVHHLALSDECIKTFDANFKVSPPLRTKSDIHALRKALKEGIIDFVTSDHTPIDIENKKVVFDEALHGTIGLESSFGILNSIFGSRGTVEILTRGRERFGIPTPVLEINSQVNLTLFDPSTKGVFSKHDILSSSKNSAFIGQAIQGKVYGTILGTHFTENHVKR